MEKQFVPKKPDVCLVTERYGWTQEDGKINLSKESRTYLKRLDNGL